MAAEDTQGLRVVLTPVQLATVLAGNSIFEPEGWSRRLWSRVGGGLETLAGGIELVGSAALLLAPEPTMLTKVGGVAPAVHGSDTTAAGMQTLWTGRSHAIMTLQAMAAAARSMGGSSEGAEEADIAVNILIPILVTEAVSAVRAFARPPFAPAGSCWAPRKPSRRPGPPAGRRPLNAPATSTLMTRKRWAATRSNATSASRSRTCAAA